MDKLQFLVLCVLMVFFKPATSHTGVRQQHYCWKTADISLVGYLVGLCRTLVILSSQRLRWFIHLQVCGLMKGDGRVHSSMRHDSTLPSCKGDVIELYEITTATDIYYRACVPRCDFMELPDLTRCKAKPDCTPPPHLAIPLAAC